MTVFYCQIRTVRHCVPRINEVQTLYTCLQAVPVAQWLEPCVSSAVVVGLIPREHMYRQYKKCIA